MMFSCQRCGKNKAATCLILTKEQDGQVRRVCVSCLTGSQELEEIHTRLEKALFRVADNYHRQLDGEAS